MCGRVLQLAAKRKAEHEERLLMDRETRERLQDRFNLAPTQDALTVHVDEDGRLVGSIRRWGLTQSTGSLLINARDDTMAAKPGYFASFRRILLPVDGFYEWPMIGGRKRAFCIRPADGGLWWFAGLAKAQAGADAFTVMTTAASREMEELHGRWPVALPLEARAAWLDASTPRAEILALLRPCPDDEIEAFEVGSAVGNARNEGPELILPIRA